MKYTKEKRYAKIYKDIALCIFKLAFLITIIIFEGCDKDEPIIDINDITIEKAKEKLPLYFNFLDYFKNQGYEFMDFHTFWLTDKDQLPDKLMVIRHDVHHRDIYYAYYAYLIELELTGKNIATYYVMLNFPSEKDNSDYLEIIKYLTDKGVDVQPHISPVDLYVNSINPWWSNLTTEKFAQLKAQNYGFKYNENIEISLTGTDTLQILNFNEQMISILSDYNTIWKNETGLSVESYCAHGTSQAFHKSVISNVRILDQQCIHEAGLCSFSTDDHYIFEFLKFLSDNERPLWIENPQQIKDGVYEFLMHPYVWSDPQSYRDEFW